MFASSFNVLCKTILMICLKNNNNCVCEMHISPWVSERKKKKLAFHAPLKSPKYDSI